jgi:3-methyl-2-oxobutanoate hydroxymethyltransferase
MVPKKPSSSPTFPRTRRDTPESAVKNARILREAGAGAVKLEGGIECVPSIQAIVAEGIPVLGHIGMLPQRVREEGGYRIKGKTPQQADQLTRDAQSLDEAGVFAMVLELVSPALAENISREVKSPTIGIGSGQGCDGQILVTYDLLGMFPWFKPRFVTPKVNVAALIQSAVSEFVRETRAPKAGGRTS